MNIEPGMKFRAVMVVSRLAQEGEIVTYLNGEKIELKRVDNKFWAKPEGSNHEILCVSDCSTIEWIAE